VSLYNAGNAYLQILPSFRGIEKLMQRETKKLAQAIDRSIAQGAGEGLINAFRDVNVNPQRIQRASQDTADKWASGFEQRVKQQLKDSIDQLPVFEPKTKLGKFDRAIQQTRKELESLSNAKIGPTGDVSFDDFGKKLDGIVSRMHRLAGETKNSQQQMRLLATAGAADNLRGGLKDARDAGLGDGRAYGGAFAEQAKAQLAKSLKSIPEINLEADTSATDRAVAAIRQRLESLNDMRIGIDIDRDAFREQLARATSELEQWAEGLPPSPLKFDLDSAASGLRDFGEKISPTIEAQTEDVGQAAGEVFAGKFAETVRTRIANAVQALPKVEIDADSSDADREIANIRAELEALGNRTIGVDIDAGEASAELATLVARLEKLDGKNVRIDVKTNALAAAAELRAIPDATNQSSVSMQQLGKEAGITMSRLGYMVVIGATLGSIVAPAATTAALAVAGIGTAALGALVGFGAIALGIVGIADAVGKIDKYQQDANKSARSFSQAQNKVTSAVEGVKDAEQSLADTRQDAADANVESQRRIADAQRNVAKAQRDSGEAVQKARENERDAIAAIGEARKDAAKATKDAIESEKDAQRSLTRANEDARDARKDLNEALRDAVQDLRDLDTAVKRNANEIDKAQTDAMTAKLELDKILTNPRASEIEKRMAREKYQAELIQIEELKNKQADLAKQKADADKNGVESTDRVKQAREKVADADERAADAQRRLVDAQQKVVDTQLDGMKRVQDAEKRAADAQKATAKAQADGAERVADAQRAVADAQRDALKTQRNGQRQIEAGQKRVADANRGLQQSYEGLGVAGGDAFDNMQDALDKLSPAGRRFATWLYGLKPYLDELRSTAQNGFLPGLQDGLQILISNYLPAFDAFLGRITRGLGAMFRATAQVFVMPEWKSFFSFIADSALPAIQGAWTATLNLARGVANLMKALAPLSAPIGEGLVDLTERFAIWSDNLETNPSFQRFLGYAADIGPRVVTLIKDMVEFLGRLVVAMAPIGSVLLAAFTATFEWINSWDIDTLTAVVEVVSVLAAGILLLSGFVRTVKFVTEVWTAVSIVSAKVQTLLAAAVTRYNTSTVGAIASTGLLNGRLFATQAAGAAGAAGMTAMSAAAGPLGIAIAGIGAIWALNYRQQKQANDATDELAGGFQELAKAYKTAADGADSSGHLISDTFRNVVSNNDDMQQTVVTLTDMGASLDDIAGAAAGSAEQLGKVMDLIDKRINQLKQQKQDNLFSIFDNQGRDDEIERLYKLQEKLKESGDQAHLTSQAMQLLNTSQKDVSYSASLATPAQLALAEAHRVLGDDSATAQQKMDALSKAEDAIRQGAVDAVEASESWNSSLITLRDSINQAKDASDKHATSLGQHSAMGLRNRDMLEQLITSANKMYDADVALNGVTKSAVDKGNAHIDQVRRLAKELGLNETATNDLIKTYGKVPKDIKTAVSLDPNSFNNVYKNLQRMLFMQDAAKRGLSPTAAEKEWKQLEGAREYQRYVPNKPGNVPGHATGGPIGGTGGPTEDANLIWASKGEFMQPANSVDYYGPEFMEALRNRAIPREAFPGYATGGAIGSRPTWQWPIKFATPKINILTDEEIFSGGGAGGDNGQLGGVTGSRGWKWQINTLRKQFPGLDLYSGYRPHSITNSGNLSWHSRDGGRAVDVEPRHDVFNFIHDTYGKDTQELIWLGDKFRNIQHGKHHVYSNALLQQHGTAGMPNAHLHWAYDKGGMLPPGYSTVFNGTGKPEPVLTQPQWDAVVNNQGSTTGPSSVYHIEFAENKLTLADLQAHERRQQALDRVGRPR
jgi:chromosome segregation ATPase